MRFSVLIAYFITVYLVLITNSVKADGSVNNTTPVFWNSFKESNSSTNNNYTTVELITNPTWDITDENNTNETFVELVIPSLNNHDENTTEYSPTDSVSDIISNYEISLAEHLLNLLNGSIWNVQGVRNNNNYTWDIYENDNANLNINSTWSSAEDNDSPLQIDLNNFSTTDTIEENVTEPFESNFNNDLPLKNSNATERYITEDIEAITEEIRIIGAHTYNKNIEEVNSKDSLNKSVTETPIFMNSNSKDDVLIEPTRIRNSNLDNHHPWSQVTAQDNLSVKNKSSEISSDIATNSEGTENDKKIETSVWRLIEEVNINEQSNFETSSGRPLESEVSIDLKFDTTTNLPWASTDESYETTKSSWSTKEETSSTFSTSTLQNQLYRRKGKRIVTDSPIFIIRRLPEEINTTKYSNWSTTEEISVTETTTEDIPTTIEDIGSTEITDFTTSDTATEPTIESTTETITDSTTEIITKTTETTAETITEGSTEIETTTTDFIGTEIITEDFIGIETITEDFIFSDTTTKDTTNADFITTDTTENIMTNENYSSTNINSPLETTVKVNTSFVSNNIQDRTRIKTSEIKNYSSSSSKPIDESNKTETYSKVEIDLRNDQPKNEEIFKKLFTDKMSENFDHANLRLINHPSCGGFWNHTSRSDDNDAGINEFPWMTLIGYTSGNRKSFLCGGSLINENYVLTVASCITFLSDLNVTSVRLGEYILSEDEDCDDINGDKFCNSGIQNIIISDIIVHPEFNQEKLLNDIALLRLSEPANITDSVKPICLPFGDVKAVNVTGEKLTISGWGQIEPGYLRLKEQKVVVTVIDNAVCQQNYDELSSGVTINSGHLCAGNTSEIKFCSGNGGGPLVYRDDNSDFFVQYGLLSLGPKFCEMNEIPSVYTRIEHYIDWILSNIKS